MLEERMERVGEPAWEQPTLVLRSEEGREIWIWPIALWVMLADARVDVLSQKGIYVLIDNAEPLQAPQWMLWKVGAGEHGRAFDPGLLAEMV
jgi:hypothetical protein